MFSEKFLKFLKIFFLILLLSYSAGCSSSSGGDDDDDDSGNADNRITPIIEDPEDIEPGIQDDKIILEKNIKGGESAVLEVTDFQNLFYGMKIEIPGNAVNKGENENIKISLEDSDIDDLLKHGKLLGQPVRLENSSNSDLNEPVILTLPAAPDSISKNDIVSVYWIDTESGDYHPVMIIDIDYVDNLITCVAAHIGVYAAAEFTANIVQSVDTGFDPEIDGFSEKSSETEAAGLAEYALWYFKYKKKGEESALFKKYDEPVLPELIKKAAQAHQPLTADSYDPDLSDDFFAKQVIVNMKETGPQLLYFKNVLGRAVLVYKYDESNDEFYIYDPDLPGEAVILDWKYDLIPYSMGSVNSNEFSDIYEWAEQYVSAPGAPDTYSLDLKITGSGKGSVEICVSDKCSSYEEAQKFDKDTLITLTAVPSDNSEFAGWSGAGCSGTGYCEINMDADIVVTAEFSRSGSESDTYTLAILKEGEGNGEIHIDNDASTACDNFCEKVFDKGTEVELSVMTDPGSEFAGWSGGGCSGVEDCVVTMDADILVTALFKTDFSTPDTDPGTDPPVSAADTFTLTISKEGTGTGIVESSNISGISCGKECSGEFMDGETVILTALASEDSDFTDWSGRCSGNDDCVVKMDADLNVTALFSDRNQSPLVRELQVPDSLCVNQSFSISYKYSDPDGLNNIKTHYISMSDGTYRYISSEGGTGQFSMGGFSLTAPGSYRIKVYVTDAQANISNIMQKTVIVSRCSEVNAPEVDNLEITSNLCEKTPFSISLEYNDPDGINDVREINIVIFEEDGTHYDKITVNANESGRFSRDNFIIHTQGIYHIEVYAQDYQGNQGEVVKKTVNVNNCL